MHLNNPQALLELRELERQVKAGAITPQEYAIAFRMVDAAHCHDVRCENKDGRLAIVNIGGKLLCGVCGRKAVGARA